MTLMRIAASQAWLDALSESIQPLVRGVLAKTGTADLLDGVWLGAPLHPALTDAPIGAMTAACALDAVGLLTRSPKLQSQADGALAVSVATAVAAATTGAADWRYLRGEERRIAAAHGLLNGVGTSLNVTSLVLRLRGRRGAGRIASALGLAVAGLAGHLGGELSYGLGLRVNAAPAARGPKEFEPVLDEAELEGTAMRRVEFAGHPVLVTRATNGAVCAIAATCSHAGGPLSAGERDGDTVTCPWHGSRFDLCSGAVRGGPAVFPQPRFEARAHEGKIELRRATGATG